MAKGSYYGYEFELTTDTASSPAYLNALRTVIEIIKPKPCARPLIRLGGDGDGAYLVPDDLSGIAACFSPGVDRQKAFEDDLATGYGIRSHMCDFSSDESRFRTPLIRGLQMFSKLWLDLPGQADSIDLESWIGQSAPSGDLILQMDIEGAEFRNILACSQDTLRRFRIIVIEVHGVATLANPSLAINVLLPFFDSFGRSFDCVHAHPNNCCGEIILPQNGMNLPAVVEFTFLRKDRRATIPRSRLETPLIPHPLDIGRNIPANAPLVLNERWLDGPRPVASRLKMLEDEIGWMRDDVAIKTKRLEDTIETTSNYLARHCDAGAAAAGQPGGRILDVAQLKEVASGCRYRLSSSYFPGRSDGEIADEGGAYFFHTDFGINQSITVDLSTERTIRLLTITNRVDGFHDRARLLFALFHRGTHLDAAEVQPIACKDGFLNGRALEISTIVPGRIARYVTITSPMHTALHFSRLRIFAE